MIDRPFHCFLTDQPTAEDALNTQRLVDALDELLLRREKPETPFSIGVFGSWGSGKSSLLARLKYHLRATTEYEQKFLPVDFSPWEYKEEPNLLVPLLLTLAEASTATLRPAVREQVQKIAKITGLSLVRLASAAGRAATGAIRGKSTEVDVHGEILEAAKTVEAEAAAKAPRVDLSDLTKLRSLVRNVIEQVRGEKTLVLLVDDLDRCHPPEKIVQLLEHIRLFLDCEGCIFIIACDRHTVVRAIDEKFKDQGSHYLEKFFQLPIHLPAPDAGRLRDLVPEAKVKGNPDVVYEWADYLRRIGAVLRHNPRRLKRFYNAWRFSHTVLLNARVPFDQFLLAKWILVRELCPKISERPALLIGLEGMREASAEEFVQAATDPERGASPALAEFLHLDRARRFLMPEEILRYENLSDAGTDFTRESVEMHAQTGSAMPTLLRRAQLQGAILDGADFSGCDLSDADLSGAKINEANFTGADLDRANFTGTEFETLTLRGAMNLETVVADAVTMIRLTDLAGEQSPLDEGAPRPA